MLSMAKGACAFGLPGSFRSAGLREAGPSKSASRSPLKLRARHLHPSEAPAQGGKGVSVGAPYPWELAADLGAAPVQPTLVDFLLRVDLDRNEIPMSQNGDPLLTLESQQPIGSVDVGAHD